MLLFFRPRRAEPLASEDERSHASLLVFSPFCMARSDASGFCTASGGLGRSAALMESGRGMACTGPKSGGPGLGRSGPAPRWRPGEGKNQKKIPLLQKRNKILKKENNLLKIFK